MPAFTGAARWTGKGGTVSIGAYPIADLQEWTLELRQRNVEVTALDDDYTERVALDHDYTVTIRKWVSGKTSVKVGMGVVDSPASLTAGLTLNVQLRFNASSAVVFAAPMLLDSARMNWPDGAATEDITLVLADSPTVIPAIT